MEFEQLKQECLACRKCGLCETRTNVVFGTGPKTAEVMLIGEGPGKNEDEQGLPFVGRSGKLLDIVYVLAVGLYFTIRTRGVQLRLLAESIRVVGEKSSSRESVSAARGWRRRVSL